MLETKERETVKARPEPHQKDSGAAVGVAGDQGRPEVIIVIGVVAVVSMAFGFVIGLFF